MLRTTSNVGNRGKTWTLAGNWIGKVVKTQRSEREKKEESMYLSLHNFYCYGCKTCQNLQRIFINLFEPNWQRMLENKISNAPRNSGLQFLLRIWNERGHVRKITWMWKKVGWCWDHGIVNNVMCSLEGGYHVFQRCIKPDAQKQWTGLP